MRPVDPKQAGTVSSYLTSWPLVQESLQLFDVSFQQGQPILAAYGYQVGPTDRLPLVIVAGALEEFGYVREHLQRLSP